VTVGPLVVTRFEQNNEFVTSVARVQILQNYAVLCSVCHFFHESMFFEILNSKYNLFVVD